MRVVWVDQVPSAAAAGVLDRPLEIVSNFCVIASAIEQLVAASLLYVITQVPTMAGESDRLQDRCQVIIGICSFA
jgi:hypothetical protein